MTGLPVEQLAERLLAAAPRCGAVRLACVDGPAGAGKTTLAGALRDALVARLGPVPLVHMDDLYEGWSGLPAAAARLAALVLAPLAAGRPGRYRRYDWGVGDWAEEHEVPPAPALVVEGCGSGDRVAAARAALLVWLDAPAAQRLERSVARDGEQLRAELVAWQHAERTHFARERTRERADLRVDGTAGGPGQRFVRLPDH